MNESTKVSIIVPVYNGEKYIEETINNLIISTYKNIEILLINDGSTDSSYDKCQVLAKKDSRIRVINQENKGVAEARNRGLQLATGNWIAFCDQDDYVCKDMYECLLRRVNSDGSDIAISGMGKLVGESYEEFEVFEDAVLNRKDIVEQAIYSILFDGYRISTQSSDMQKVKIGNCIWKCLISKDIIDRYNITFKSFINFEDDRTFLLEILSVASRVSLVKECFYYWRINLESETYRKKYIECLEEKMKSYSNYEQKIFDQANIEEEIREIYYKVEACNNFVQMIENEYNNIDDKNFREKINYLKKNIYNEGFKENIVERKKLKSNVVKKRITLLLLEHRCVILAYLFDIFYLEFKKKALKHRSWTVLEKYGGKKAR